MKNVYTTQYISRCTQRCRFSSVAPPSISWMPRPVSSIAWNDLYIGYTKPTTLHARFAPKPKIIMTVSAARPPTTCQLSSPVACASAWIPSLCRIVSANPRCCSSLVRSFEAGAAFSSFGLRLAPRLERAGER